jgi:uncharacterized protein (TIGR03437 family)
MIFCAFLRLALSILAMGSVSIASGSGVLPDDPFRAFSLSGLPTTNLTTSNVTGMPFARAWRIRTPSKAPAAWEYRLIGRPEARIAKGDTLVARLWMRTIQPSHVPGYARFVVEAVADPYTKSVEWHMSAGSDWRLYEIPFAAAGSYEARDYTVQIWVPSGPQEIEIGGLSVTNAGAGVPFSQLRLSEYPYTGGQKEAAWRKAANDRIDKLRKGDIAVIVRDDDGKPVADAAVRISMRRHTFGFGTAVDAATLTASAVDSEKYRNLIKSWFNKTVLENDLKWPEWERNRQNGISAIQWLRAQHGGAIRGHNLVWPDWQFLPGDLRFNQGSPESLRARVRDHIADIAGVLKGQVSEWDVLNEPVSTRELTKIVGDSEMAAWFRQARAADPAAKLYVNEYSILTGGGNDIPQQDAYLDLIRLLDSHGAPVDGIGIQAHFDTAMTDPERVLSILDRFAATGKPLQITELSIRTGDEAAQAAYLRDFLTAAFSHRAVNGILLWGFWEGRHFAPEAALVRKDWSLKPAGQVWSDLVLKEWRTDNQGRTSSDGTYRTRGFAGEYDVEVEYGGRKRSYSMNVSPGTGNYLRIGRVTPGRIVSAGIVNAASYARGAVAPGQIVTIWGEGIGADTLTQAQLQENRLPTFVADTIVTFDGIAAPILYSAPGQLSAIVPYGVSGITTVQVTYNGTETNAVRLPVAEMAPGVFANSDGSAVVINGNDSTLNSPEVAAARGSVVALYVTGGGAVTPALADGVAPTGPAYPKLIRSPSVFFANKPGKVVFEGLVYPGVTQINVAVPEDAPTGPGVQLSVRIGAAESQPGVTVSIR